MLPRTPLKGGWEYLIYSPVWNLRAVICFPFSYLLLFFCLVLCFFYLTIFLPNVYSLDFFLKENSQTFFIKSLAFFFYGSCWVARVWQVVCVAFCHLALVFAVKHLYFKKTFLFVSAHSFFRFLFNMVLLYGMVDDTSMS